jgi:pimeloyl-ACP methyl ester carboxylesterase
MTTYALVHGASHAAWHWHLVEDEMRRRGHRTVAVDLPCDDPQAGAAEYAEVVLHALADEGDDVVLVAHSLGGLTIPLVAAHRPVERMVFVAGLLPQIGVSMNDQIAAADDDIVLPGVERAGDRDGFRPEAAIEVFFPDVEHQLACAAVRRLRRQRGLPFRETSPLQKWPDVPVSYVLCADDRVVNPKWARTAVPERLGVEPTELPGSHSPFLARPADLVDLIVGCC